MKSFRLLKANEIECRISTVKENGVSLLLYKDARCDQNILDETVGPDRWQRAHELIDGKLFCKVGIWFDRRNDGYGEWVWKQDVGTESFTEKEKGQASDAFKRACFNWGIGRELYSAPFIWIPSKKNGGLADITPRNHGFTCYDRFTVTHINYSDDETISELEIVHKKSGLVAYTFGGQSNVRKQQKVQRSAQRPQSSRTEGNRQDPYTDIRNMKIAPVKIQVLQQELSKRGIEESFVLGTCKVSRMEDITEGQFRWIANNFEKIEDNYRQWKARAS